MDKQLKQFLVNFIEKEGITIIGTYTLRDLSKEFPRYVRFSELFALKTGITFELDKVEDFTDVLYEHIKRFENCKTIADCEIENERLYFMVREISLRALIETGELDPSRIDEAREKAREVFDQEYGKALTESLVEMFQEMQ